MTKTLGQRIRELRDGKDLSLRELAKKTGVTPAHLSDIELGRRFPSPELLKRIAEFLKVSTAELEKHDSRPPVDQIKRLSELDPAYGFAFRQMVDKLIEKKMTPEDVLRSLKSGRSDKKEPE